MKLMAVQSVQRQQGTSVDKGMSVLLEEQVLQHPTLGHQPEQVVVTPKKHMQPAENQHMRLALAQLMVNLLRRVLQPATLL